MSGAQIVATAAWLSALAVPWYVALTGRTADGLTIFIVSAAIGVLAGGMHQGQVMRRARTVATLADQMKDEAVRRMTGTAEQRPAATPKPKWYTQSKIDGSA